MSKTSITVSELQKYFDYFKTDCLNKDHSRYKSWEHCKKIFNKAFEENLSSENSEPDRLDFLSLHLGFYLASWGMMRGSTELLQRDYKIHEKAVKVILDNSKLNNLELADIPDNWSNIASFREKLETAYKTSGNDHLTNLSDTLVTKIIMGVYGIVPAYDNYVCNTLKKYDFCNAKGKYGEDSIKAICHYFNKPDAQKFLSQCQKEISQPDLVYPQMKIIDMILWEIGAHMKEPFSEVWKRIKKYEGEHFALKSNNEPFAYKIENDCFIPLRPTNAPKVSKEMMNKAYDMWPVSGPGVFNKAGIMAHSYIFGVFNDERIIKKEED